MYSLLVKLLVIAALAQLGMNSLFGVTCKGKRCLSNVQAAQRAVLDIKWKPISVFPEEAKRFR